MRLVARRDLGGYASDLEVLKQVAEQDIDRPFVLLSGPNGAGKSALLRMIRNTTGASGERIGYLADASGFEGPASPETCGDDAGKLAAFVGGWKPGMPDKSPGVLDLAALGWKGQRTWLFDSRAETKMQAAGAFDDNDFAYHVDLIMSSQKASHGQMLHHGWFEAIRWGLGLVDAEDAYDHPDRVPAARRKLLEMATGGRERSKERWLLLDEPETALDAEMLMVGLCTLLRHAEIGKLRVFCASHSPMFAAGLADNPAVQVVDLGGQRPWFGLQRWAIEAARSPETVAAIADDITVKLRKQVEERARKAAEERRREVSEAIKGLSRKAQEVLLSAYVAKDMRLTNDNTRDGLLSRETLDPLDWRKLVKVRGTRMKPEVTLTELGIAAAERITENIERKMAREDSPRPASRAPRKATPRSRKSGIGMRVTPKGVSMQVPAEVADDLKDYLKAALERMAEDDRPSDDDAKGMKP